MKLTFEGTALQDIIDQMEDTLDQVARGLSSPLKAAQGPGPDVMRPVDIPGDNPVNNLVGHPVAVEKPKRERTEKQRENDERLRVAAKAKIAAKKAAKTVSDPMVPPIPPPPKTAEGMDPAEVVKVRQKTIEELQAAYANGFQKEVFELLARFGNGAKSFRELPPDAFVPIREAIDNGALT